MSSVSNLIPKAIKAITPHDTTPTSGCVGLRCLTDGTVKITDAKGNATSIALTAGQEIRVQIVLVWSTGTTGTYLGYFEI